MKASNRHLTSALVSRTQLGFCLLHVMVGAANQLREYSAWRGPRRAHSLAGAHD